MKLFSISVCTSLAGLALANPEIAQPPATTPAQIETAFHAVLQGTPIEDAFGEQNNFIRDAQVFPERIFQSLFGRPYDTNEAILYLDADPVEHVSILSGDVLSGHSIAGDNFSIAVSVSASVDFVALDPSVAGVLL